MQDGICILCLYEDQMYSHECKDEVKCEPEVVLKVPAGGGEVLHYSNSWGGMNESF